MEATLLLQLAGVICTVAGGFWMLVYRSNKDTRAHFGRLSERLENRMTVKLGETDVHLTRMEGQSEERHEKLHARISKMGGEITALDREFRNGFSDMRERVTRIETKVLNGK